MFIRNWQGCIFCRMSFLCKSYILAPGLTETMGGWARYKGRRRIFMLGGSRLCVGEGVHDSCVK